MPSLLFCGPKMAACGIVISIWGVIMLICCLSFLPAKGSTTQTTGKVMLGIFFSAKSAVLIEDVPFTEEDIRNDKNPPGTIYGLYNQVGINCFIAAAIYVAVGAVSLCQVRLNKRQEYMVT
ncbi:ribonuclease kappa-B isoform X1 [Coregonus clupeaformis]|uniref:ribonuclease kappa-B isoform X1 n=1 Tax=Coregonus clupeaformis TaxID=59861 RepID=UPI001BDF789E|nr:ribonuclease kappa-B isoform X1 [Coregonus clupeaformis]